MIRFVVIALIILAVWVIGLQIVRFAKKRRIDWTGLAFAIGFIVLAFYLRNVTGLEY